MLGAKVEEESCRSKQQQQRWKYIGLYHQRGDGPTPPTDRAMDHGRYRMLLLILCFAITTGFIFCADSVVQFSCSSKKKLVNIRVVKLVAFANVDITSICGSKLKIRGRKCLVKNIHQKRARITTAHCLAAQQFNFSKFRRRDVSNRHFLLSLLLNIILPPS